MSLVWRHHAPHGNVVVRVGSPSDATTGPPNWKRCSCVCGSPATKVHSIDDHLDWKTAIAERLEASDVCCFSHACCPVGVGGRDRSHQRVSRRFRRDTR